MNPETTTSTSNAANAAPVPAARPLAGKVAFVTGGAGGIGAAIAQRLAADGAAVALTWARSEAE
ncbi:MAG TPA: SDR family NAD(P)-dependent oxidoreductase, partial [Plasticicumulans sp.]|nr:SDR family NAD(P)-dependent oxidoreductase [Plasticicumulans sp.]